MTIKLTINSSDDMERLGSQLSRACKCGLLILLQGALGAGKTTLVRGFIRSRGHEGVIRSPTYTLVEPYENNDCSIYHFDLYRLADADELEYLGVRDYFNNRAICLVEWPDRVPGLLPQSDLEIRINYTKNGRTVEFSGLNDRGNLVINRVISEAIQ